LVSSDLNCSVIFDVNFFSHFVCNVFSNHQFSTELQISNSMMEFKPFHKNMNGVPSQPFFSLGVTTYNRKTMLLEYLSSILGQTFSDFELIVGNDYIKENISTELVGVHDPRIRFVNHA